MAKKHNTPFIIPMKLTQADHNLIDLVILGLENLKRTKQLDTRVLQGIGELHVDLCSYVLQETCFCIDAASILLDATAKELTQDYENHRSAGVLKQKGNEK